MIEPDWTKGKGREVSFNEEQMEDWIGLVRHLNHFFMLQDDLPVTKIRVEWANGFGTEIHAGKGSSYECGCSTCGGHNNE